jgi:hypothetical protein
MVAPSSTSLQAVDAYPFDLVLRPSGNALSAPLSFWLTERCRVSVSASGYIACNSGPLHPWALSSAIWMARHGPPSIFALPICTRPSMVNRPSGPTIWSLWRVPPGTPLKKNSGHSTAITVEPAPTLHIGANLGATSWLFCLLWRCPEE